MNDPDRAPRRALILAGGGMKVAAQAGVLQVWLDEAGIEFDHADGASGGAFNLAMYCQGMSGSQIAENWRNVPLAHGISFNWLQYLRLFWAESLLTYDNWRRHVFGAWGLDFERIRASPRSAVFNVYNFTDHRLETLPGAQMTEDLLVACVSLPMWFPPVVIDGKRYIDPVYVTDANLIDAVERGADELWIVWTVSEQGRWRDGFVANYFQIIEASANGHLRRDLARIEASNRALAAGAVGEFDRHVEVRILRDEVPLHYLLNLSADRIRESVNRGVEHARRWCREQGIALSGEQPPSASAAPVSLSFTEQMKGYVSPGEQDFQAGFESPARAYLMFELSIRIDDVERFVSDPRHGASATGYVDCAAFGGRRDVSRGDFNLFVDEGDPTAKKMLYRLYFEDEDGTPLTLSGFKRVRDDPGLDLWSDTSTLYTRVLRGHPGAAEEAASETLASGIVAIHTADFLRQLASFRTAGPTLRARVAATSRFGVFFLGKLWDVYANRVLQYGPF